MRLAGLEMDSGEVLILDCISLQKTAMLVWCKEGSFPHSELGKASHVPSLHSTETPTLHDALDTQFSAPLAIPSTR